MSTRHDQLVQHQFGTTAGNYVTSAVHASGEDLERMAHAARQCRPARALDLGCGGGHVSYAIAPFSGQVAACDLSSEMCAAVVAEAGRRGLDNIHVHTASAQDLPFADNQFDFLACRFSAHHWHDVPAGLAEARRVLRPGAPLLLLDTIAPPMAAADTHLQAVEVLRDPSHVRDYSLAEWRCFLDQAGFSITTSHSFRLRMEFASWIARMRTPPERAQAIRSLQQVASKEVVQSLAIEADGSFTLETVLIEAC